ncbi:hypothetical protein [Aurantiacibacter odishensis]|uniref:hypothetical protein n=1 Tax=Aurantiacibacter odishensis TaxID=1155476 RepID=UPI000E72CC4B|nr:hypothetical protein [Aurantiacibacter odishensis]
MLKTIGLVLALNATVLAAAPAQAGESEDGNFTVGAVVPEVCGVSIGDFRIDRDADAVSGFVQEYCNGSGFQIFASHRRLAENEAAEVEYDGIVAPMQQSGLTFLALRSGPRFRQVPVTIHNENLEADLQLSFSIAAI